MEEENEFSETEAVKKANAKKNRQKKEKTKLMEWVETALYALVAIGLAWLFVTFVAQRTVVDGSSMSPTLSDGDNVITDKITYRFKDPERFDIIVFPHTDTVTGNTVAYIKRIIGLPGETLLLKDGQVYINGELLDDPYGVMDVNDGEIWDEEFTLGDDEYFVLGDNRTTGGSYDSRYKGVGLIKRDDIIGRAIFRIWPLSEFGSLG
ncbi:MAG: signal peptidase I [Lachnospiraceae bacterium]|nr:signal peptidase I [Lachnospiraceae bacterium]